MAFLFISVMSGRGHVAGVRERGGRLATFQV